MDPIDALDCLLSTDDPDYRETAGVVRTARLRLAAYDTIVGAIMADHPDLAAAVRQRVEEKSPGKV